MEGEQVLEKLVCVAAHLGHLLKLLSSLLLPKEIERGGDLDLAAVVEHEEREEEEVENAKDPISNNPYNLLNRT